MNKVNKNAIYVDGGLSQYRFPKGQGYAKSHLGNSLRTQCFLTSLDNTNNEAELFAILFGITQAVKKNSKLIYSDSEWSVNTCIGKYKPKNPRFKLVVYAIRSLLNFYEIKLKWISRYESPAT